MKESLWSLLTKRTFLPLFITQFLSAFNDNAFKLAMLTLISYFLTSNQVQSEQYQAIASAVFTLPFFLFSATAGELADTYDKAYLTRVIKFFEVILMSIGGIALYAGNILWMMLALAGMGIHSTFFGPIKYAILPDHLQSRELLGATGLIEASTFLAILLGTTFGSLSIGGAKTGSVAAISITFLAALLGFICSWFIPPAPAHNKERYLNWNIWRTTIKMLRSVIRNKRILPVAFTISWFWLIGVVILTKLPDYAHYVLHAQTSVFAFFLVLFSIGIGAGSLVTNYILSGQVSLHYVPLAMLLLSIFATDLYLISPEQVTVTEHLVGLKAFLSQINHIRISIDLFFLALSGGLFVVPLYTFLQVVSERGMRARTIALNNLCNAMFMVVGTILVMFLLYIKMSIPQVFFILALLNVIAAILLKFFMVKLKFHRIKN